MTLDTQHAGFSQLRLERIAEHLLRNYIEPQKICGCQVAVGRRGVLAYQKSFGRMDVERDKPWRDDTIVRLFSMTKPITSIALMTLYERGLFQLSDPISRFFPEWRLQRVWQSGQGEAMQTVAPKRPANIRDMLSHTAGLTYGNLLAAIGGIASAHPVDQMYAEAKVRRDRSETLDVFMSKLGKMPLRYHPGERWMYSLATDVCGALVERISGMPFDRYLQETILGPLGMKDTAFHVPAEKAERFAANYRRGPNKQLVLADDPQTSAYLTPPAFLSGGGGLAGTIADYVRFCEMLRRGGELNGQRIIGSRTLALMHMNHLEGGKLLTDMAIDSFSETANDGVGFGLGFASVVDPIKAMSPSVGDYYWGGAASTIFWVDPREDLYVVFLTQLMPSATFNFRGQLKALVYGAIEN